MLLIQDARTYRTGDGVVALELGLKRRRVPEHFDLRLRRGGSGPRRNVLVECRRRKKHVRHVSHFRRVPIPDVLVESYCRIESAMHTGHLRRVPTPNVLVERRSEKKCLSHIRHLRCIPTSNGLVERFSAIKRRAHSSHSRCIPSRNIGVEFVTSNLRICSPLVQKIPHICHSTDVPIRHRAVIRRRRSVRRTLSRNWCFTKTRVKRIEEGFVGQIRKQRRWRRRRWRRRWRRWWRR
jgi:hypothetical protein